MNPMLKPPGNMRLKLKYDQLLSNFNFKFNLRRYNKAVKAVAAPAFGTAGPIFGH